MHHLRKKIWSKDALFFPGNIARDIFYIKYIEFVLSLKKKKKPNILEVSGSQNFTNFETSLLSDMFVASKLFVECVFLYHSARLKKYIYICH